jgi:hypothetical protein
LVKSNVIGILSPFCAYIRYALAEVADAENNCALKLFELVVFVALYNDFKIGNGCYRKPLYGFSGDRKQ